MMVHISTLIVVIVVLSLISGRLFAGSVRDFDGTLFEYLCDAVFLRAIFLTALGLFILMVLTTNTAYIIRSQDDYTRYETFGSPSYTFPDGRSVKLNPPAIVNLTDTNMVLETVVYVAEGDDPGEIDHEPFVFIEAKSTAHFTGKNIDYFFSKMPPQEKQVKSSKDIDKWLRTESAWKREWGHLFEEEPEKPVPADGGEQIHGRPQQDTPAAPEQNPGGVPSGAPSF